MLGFPWESLRWAASFFNLGVWPVHWGDDTSVKTSECICASSKAKPHPRHCVSILRSGSGLQRGGGEWVSQCVWRERACPRGCQLALGECESVRDHRRGIQWCPDCPRPTPLQCTQTHHNCPPHPPPRHPTPVFSATSLPPSILVPCFCLQL